MPDHITIGKGPLSRVDVEAVKDMCDAVSAVADGVAELASRVDRLASRTDAAVPNGYSVVKDSKGAWHVQRPDGSHLSGTFYTEMQANGAARAENRLTRKDAAGDAVMLSTASGDLGIVQSSKAAAEAQKVANESGTTVTIRDAVTDKVIKTVKPNARKDSVDPTKIKRGDYVKLNRDGATREEVLSVNGNMIETYQGNAYHATKVVKA